MHTGIHHLAAVNLASPAENAFRPLTLDYRYRSDGQEHRAFGVAIEPSLRSAIASGEVTALQAVEVLRPSLLAELLPGANVLVLGVLTSSGAVHAKVPHRIALAKWLGITGGCVVTAAMAYLTLTTSSALGLIGAIVGTHVVRSCLQLPGSYGVAQNLSEQ